MRQEKGRAGIEHAKTILFRPFPASRRLERRRAGSQKPLAAHSQYDIQLHLADDLHRSAAHRFFKRVACKRFCIWAYHEPALFWRAVSAAGLRHFGAPAPKNRFIPLRGNRPGPAVDRDWFYCASPGRKASSCCCFAAGVGGRCLRGVCQYDAYNAAGDRGAGAYFGALPFRAQPRWRIGRSWMRAFALSAAGSYHRAV